MTFVKVSDLHESELTYNLPFLRLLDKSVSHGQVVACDLGQGIFLLASRLECVVISTDCILGVLQFSDRLHCGLFTLCLGDVDYERLLHV